MVEVISTKFLNGRGDILTRELHEHTKKVIIFIFLFSAEVENGKRLHFRLKTFPVTSDLNVLTGNYLEYSQISN